MLKNVAFFISFMLYCIYSHAQNNAVVFFDNLKKHCGKSYEGIATAGGDNETFKGKTLRMQVLLCDDNTIKIPFYVGEDKSRTWILKLIDGVIELKHDHRHQDGTEDKVTMYGGTASNSGSVNLQMFPADPHTVAMLPAAAHNVWWMGLDKDKFTYNLRRIGTDRQFTVEFDLSKPIELDWQPWGWNNN